MRNTHIVYNSNLCIGFTGICVCTSQFLLKVPHVNSCKLQNIVQKVFTGINELTALKTVTRKYASLITAMNTIFRYSSLESEKHGICLQNLCKFLLGSLGYCRWPKFTVTAGNCCDPHDRQFVRLSAR